VLVGENVGRFAPAKLHPAVIEPLRLTERRLPPSSWTLTRFRSVEVLPAPPGIAVSGRVSKTSALVVSAQVPARAVADAVSGGSWVNWLGSPAAVRRPSSARRSARTAKSLTFGTAVFRGAGSHIDRRRRQRRLGDAAVRRAGRGPRRPNCAPDRLSRRPSKRSLAWICNQVHNHAELLKWPT